MGLGFARPWCDPRAGANKHRDRQWFGSPAAHLTSRSTAHLVSRHLAESFQLCPSRPPTSTRTFWRRWPWGSAVFESGRLIALPSVIALVIVNPACARSGHTRARRSLNLFGIGFTTPWLCGFFVSHRRPRLHHACISLRPVRAPCRLPAARRAPRRRSSLMPP